MSALEALAFMAVVILTVVSMSAFVLAATWRKSA